MIKLLDFGTEYTFFLIACVKIYAWIMMVHYNLAMSSLIYQVYTTILNFQSLCGLLPVLVVSVQTYSLLPDAQVLGGQLCSHLYCHMSSKIIMPISENID